MERYNLGVIYFDQGLMEKAYAEFQEALRLRADDQEARQYLGRIKR